MYASIRKYRTDPTSATEEAKRAKDSFLPIISKAPGFVAFYHLNVGNGEFATISIFEDRASAEESNKMAADWVKRTAASLLPSPPEVTVGEVVFHAERGGTATAR